MVDSDDDLLHDELSAALSSRPSRGHKYTPKGPLSPDGNKLLQDLMNKQAAERRKIEEIRASAPPMSSPFDDMDMDDDDLEEDALASLLPSSKKKKKGGAEAEDEEVKMCLDNDDDIDALRDQIKGLGQGVDKVDMEKEDFGDWKGLGSVFSMAERSQMRSVEFRSFVRDAGQWDAGYRTLYDALVGAGDSLPDLLCALGVARWLGATRRRVPPHLMEWLLYVVALTDDPAMAHGAFLNIQALMRAKHLAEPRPVCLEGWVLPFSTVAKILEYYGIGRLSTSATGEEEEEDGEIEFMVDVDTTVPEQQHMLRSGIPPALNLAGLLQTLSWAVEDGRVKMTEAEARRLLCCTLLLSIDRYLQADCPDELRELTAALLQTIPDSQWPSPAILDITNATLNSTRIKLSDDSAIHIARSLCVGESSDREKDLVASLASYVLTTRVLPEVADAVKELSVLTEPESYMCTLLDAMNSPDLDACFEESERTYRAGYCVELLCKTLAKRCIPRPSLPTMHEKLAIFEKSRRLSMRDETAQTTKDILTQEIRALRCLAPPSKGLRQTKLSFGTKSQESQD